MAKKKKGKKYTSWKEVKKARLDEDAQARVEREVLLRLIELDLQEVRKLVGQTQVELAKVANMTQPEISKIEAREDLLLSTLQRYIEALGGQLTVLATFGDRTVRLQSPTYKKAS